MFELLIWFLFGGSIVTVFMILLTIACFKILADLIGFPTDEVSFIINMVIKYFWPAFVAGGFLTSVTRRKRSALIAVGIWLLILVLFCFIPGNVTVPDVADVAAVNVTYAYNFYKADKTVNYKYSGFSIKDPAVIAQIVEMVDDAKYTFSHQILLTKGWWNYDRVFVEFMDANGESLKKLTVIQGVGIQVDGWIDRFYRIKPDTGFDAQWLDNLAHNGI